MAATKERWTSRTGLILAMAGNAVGLGNFLRFPVQAVQNGGGAFIIPYLVSFFLLGIPLLWVEWATGRFGGKSGMHSMPLIMNKMGNHRFWKYFGVFGIFTNIGVAAYYCYIESWTLSYVIHSLAQTFNGMSQVQVAQFFGSYIDLATSTLGIPFESLIMYIVVIAINTFFLSKGLSGGVEKVAKVGMPLLLLFGVILAIKGLTLGESAAPDGCKDCNAFYGLNYLWEPQLDKLWSFKVWLAAAGQIFFTLSVGMGTIQSYASFVRSSDDIALNAMTAGWMNSFVEVVLGASIVIPISVGYLGLDWVKENAGFAMAFQTMPYLFNQLGAIFGTAAGFMWFGLLFFAGITSSLAMGTPWMTFISDSFEWSRQKAALSFGVLVFAVGLPTVVYFSEGVFDEYDYWAGTFAFVLFALVEVILFAWVFGIDKGWREIVRGADIRIPTAFKYIIKYVTTTMLAIIFVLSVIEPADWNQAIKGNWQLSKSSVLAKLTNQDIVANRSNFSDYFESEVDGIVTHIYQDKSGSKNIELSKLKSYFIDDFGRTKPVPENLLKSEVAFIDYFDSLTVIKTYTFAATDSIVTQLGKSVEPGTQLAKGYYVNKIFHINMARLLLLSLWVFVAVLVFIASRKRKRVILRNRSKFL